MPYLLAAENAVDTWGIPGPMFLGIYATLFAVTVVGVVLSRRAANPKPPSSDDAASFDQYELAFINGGARLAAFTALYNLYENKVIGVANEVASADYRNNGGRGGWSESGNVDPRHFALLSASSGLYVIGDLPVNTHPVERTAFALVAAKPGTRPAELMRHVQQQPAMKLLDADMTSRCLVRSSETRLRMRLSGLWFVPLLALGAIRALMGAGNGKPIELLLMFSVATVATMCFFLGGVDRMTKPGKQVLDHAKKEHAGGVDNREAEVARFGATAVKAASASAIALYGTKELWAQHPNLAMSLGATSSAPSYRSSGSRRSRHRDHSTGSGGSCNSCCCSGSCGGGGGGGGCGGGGGGCGG